ncbi:MAG: hypothetical protein ACI88G_000664 [Woeseiaceae bacterium]|jgi:hypothetical protein
MIACAQNLFLFQYKCGDIVLEIAATKILRQEEDDIVFDAFRDCQ